MDIYHEVQARKAKKRGMLEQRAVAPARCPAPAPAALSVYDEVTALREARRAVVPHEPLAPATGILEEVEERRANRAKAKRVRVAAIADRASFVGACNRERGHAAAAHSLAAVVVMQDVQVRSARRERDAWMREALESRGKAIATSASELDADGCLRGLLDADREGLLEGEGFLRELLQNIGESLRGQRGRWKKRKPKLVAFYAKLSAKAGPEIASFVSDLLRGPSRVRVRSWRRDSYVPRPGRSDEAIEANVRNAVRIYERHGFDCAKEPVFACEDGSGVQARLDVHFLRSKGLNRLYGLDDGPYDITSIDQALRLVKDKGFSTTLYVVLLVPGRRGLRATPVIMFETNNKFAGAQVHETIWTLLRVWRRVTGANTLVTSGADGDARLRRESLALIQIARGERPGARLVLDHVLFRGIGVPHIDGYGHFLVVAGEYMHTSWRLRVLYLSVKRPLAVPIPVAPAAFQKEAAKVNPALTKAHFDPQEKQAWRQTKELFGLDAEGRVLDRAAKG